MPRLWQNDRWFIEKDFGPLHPCETGFKIRDSLNPTRSFRPLLFSNGHLLFHSFIPDDARAAFVHILDCVGVNAVDANER